MIHNLETDVMKSCTVKSTSLAESANGIHINLTEVDERESMQQTRLQHHKDTLVTTAVRFTQQMRPDIPTGWFGKLRW